MNKQKYITLPIILIILGLTTYYFYPERWYDWTDGCIALTDAEIDELYAAVKIGTPIEIKP